jgi:hypothetical protein
MKSVSDTQAVRALELRAAADMSKAVDPEKNKID